MPAIKVKYSPLDSPLDISEKVKQGSECELKIFSVIRRRRTAGGEFRICNVGA
jgi:hypothetical protein